jgi:hypothetical protein
MHNWAKNGASFDARHTVLGIGRVLMARGGDAAWPAHRAVQPAAAGATPGAGHYDRNPEHSCYGMIDTFRPFSLRRSPPVYHKIFNDKCRVFPTRTIGAVEHVRGRRVPVFAGKSGRAHPPGRALRNRRNSFPRDHNPALTPLPHIAITDNYNSRQEST